MYYSSEQIWAADNIPIEDILKANNEEVFKRGNNVYWKLHDSLHIKGASWFRFSTNEGGHSIDFCTRFLDMKFTEAVDYLLKNFRNDMSSEENSKITNNTPAKVEELPPKEELYIPKKNYNNKNLCTYLIKKRCLSERIVSLFISKGILYESGINGRINFIGKDAKGNIRNISFHGSKEGEEHVRMTARGSDGKYGFNLMGKSHELYVFESAIDMMSYMDLHPDGLFVDSYLTLNGVNPNALVQTINDYPYIRNVHLCLDNDIPGETACSNISIKMESMGKEVCRECSVRKDWNEDLKEVKHTDLKNPYDVYVKAYMGGKLYHMPLIDYVDMIAGIAGSDFRDIYRRGGSVEYGNTFYTESGIDVSDFTNPRVLDESLAAMSQMEEESTYAQTMG